MERLVYSAEEMADIVKQIEQAMDRGKSLEKACVERGIEEQTFYRWRTKFTASPAPSTSIPAAGVAELW